jgi:hypothetical protein
MGRRTKLTPEVSATICGSVRDGNYLVTACRVAGQEYDTVLGWLARGRKEATGIYVQFYHDLTRAESESETALVEIWRDGSRKDWRGARDLLARRFPERWKERREDVLTGDPARPVRVVRVPWPEDQDANAARGDD